MGRVFLGLAIIIVGSFFIIKTDLVLRAFGRVRSFEKYLGAEGGSRLGYKIIGLLFLFFGILITTGLINDFLPWLLKPLLKAGNPDAEIE